MRWLKMSWAFNSAFLKRASCRHALRRNLLGVLVRVPPFPSTPPLTQTSLQTGLGFSCADPRDGPLFGRIADTKPRQRLGAQETHRSQQWAHADKLPFEREQLQHRHQWLYYHSRYVWHHRNHWSGTHCSRRSEKKVKIPSVSLCFSQR